MRTLSSLAALLLLAGCFTLPEADQGELVATTDADGDGAKAASEGGTDCNDADAAVHPDADEVCDGVDNDCNGLVDDRVQDVGWVDGDADGFGAGNRLADCDRPELVDDGTDCDDTDGNVSPAATEICDGIDNDCDGEVDESGIETRYADRDGDGYGDPATGTNACDPNLVDNDDDCDDDNDAVSPDGEELCNGTDDDCDGSLNGGATDASTWYLDEDYDGFGGSISVVSCAPPDDQPWGETEGDCDDTDPDIWPGADEIWYDGVDQDCSGGSDHDQDGDGEDAVASGGVDRNDTDPDCSFTCADGGTPIAAGASCDAILAQYPSTPDGVRWIDPNGDDDFSDVIEVYCDMTTDGGGWSLIWKTEENDVFEYDSPYWTTTDLLNEDDLTEIAGTAKLRGFNVLPFDDIRVCTPVGCLAHAMTTPQNSAVELFSGPWLGESIDDSNYDKWNGLFGSTDHRSCPPGQQPGFNVEGAQKCLVRWGLISNHPNQNCQNDPTNDADGVIGIGFVSDDEAERQMGSAGFNSSHGSLHGIDTFPRLTSAWMWVR